MQMHRKSGGYKIHLEISEKWIEDAVLHNHSCGVTVTGTGVLEVHLSPPVQAATVARLSNQQSREVGAVVGVGARFAATTN